MSWRAFAAWAAVSAALSACGPYPRDVENTTERVTSSGELRAGVVAGAREKPAARAAARRVAERAGARVSYVDGVEETLLPRLEKGEVHLVVGLFAKDSPWKKRVALTKPVAGADPPKDEPVLRFAVRKGENRWLTLVETTAEARR